MSIKVTVLSGSPVSGTVREYFFDAKSQCSWFCFEDDSGEEWVGVFGCSELTTSCNTAIPFSDGKNIFVIAAGQGYIVECSTRKLRYKTSIDCLTSVIAAPSRDLIIAADYTDLYAFDSQNLIWHSDRVALDGIKLDSSTRDGMFGKVWQMDDWYSCTLQYKEWKFAQGSRLSTDWFKYA